MLLHFLETEDFTNAVFRKYAGLYAAALGKQLESIRRVTNLMPVGNVCSNLAFAHGHRQTPVPPDNTRRLGIGQGAAQVAPHHRRKHLAYFHHFNLSDGLLTMKFFFAWKRVGGVAWLFRRL